MRREISLGAPAHLAFNGLAGRTLFGGAREHRVLAGHQPSPESRFQRGTLR